MSLLIFSKKNLFFLFNFTTLKPKFGNEWISVLDLQSFVQEGEGSNPSVPSYLVWDRVSSMTVSSARIDPTINGYLEQFGAGKQESCAKAQDGWPPSPIEFPG